jgi:hypothetical protein
MAETIIEIVPGATNSWELTVREPDRSTPKDLTALSKAWMTFKRDEADPDPGIVQLSIGAGIQTQGLANEGKLVATMTPSQSANFDFGTRYIYGVRLLMSNSVVDDPDGLSGPVKVMRAPTHTNT